MKGRREIVKDENGEKDEEIGLCEGLVDIAVAELSGAVFVYRMFSQ
jgi:hypothetical protein